MNLLEIKDLVINFDTYRGTVKALRGINLHLEAGESLAIVGESGSGKSVLAHSIMKLIPMPPGRVVSGSITLDGEDILSKNEKEMRSIRGVKVGMIFQDPMTSLNPTMKIGDQIAEGIVFHEKISWKDARNRALDLLKRVKISKPKDRMHQYPHELSGGMRQRVMIAIALSSSPQLLIADEPTTALDVTVQASILELLEELKRDFNMAIIMITHDLAIVSEVADRVAVMYSGRIVEEAKAKNIFTKPQHPYTEALLKSIPTMDMENKRELFTIDGRPPDLIRDIVGCPFAERCTKAMDICKKDYPKKSDISKSHFVHCWLKEGKEK